MHSAGTTLGMYMISVNTKYISSVHFFQILIQNSNFTEGSWDECMKGEFQLPFILLKLPASFPQKEY